MSGQGIRKAAFLLMSLDSRTANELLRGLPPESIQEIAMELAQIEASGQADPREKAKIIKEFGESLANHTGQNFSVKTFFGEMLSSMVGVEKAEQIQAQVRSITEKSNPFWDIQSANTDELVLALEGEHAQTIAVVLSELPSTKSQEVLSLLSVETQKKAVCRITNLESVRPEVKRRIATMVSERIKAFKGETLPERKEQTLRKLAIMLSGLDRKLADRLLEEIGQHDEETCAMVRKLMIVWEDISSIADRSMQEVLRSVESGKLAVALYGADDDIKQKIISNISERAAQMIEEEMSLMQEPMEDEILEARELVVAPLRKANEEGTLRVVGR